MRTRFLSPDEPALAEALAQVEHDFFHRPEYLRLTGCYEHGEPLVFLAEEGDARFLVPMVVRPVRAPVGRAGEDLFDATSPYGYASPLLTAPPAEAEDFTARAAVAFREGLRERRVVSCFCRLHPHLEAPPAGLAKAGDVICHGPTVSVDLTLPEDEITRQMRRDHRQSVRRAEREGQVASIDEGWAELDAFIDIYYETMRRLDARAFYFFPRAYFEGLRDRLRGRVHLAVARVGGEVAAAGLMTEAGGIVNAFLAGTANRFVASSPTKLLNRFACSWAKARGNRVFHLGGGVGGREDRLFWFKAGFSPRRHAYCTWRVTPDARLYEELVARWADLTHGRPPTDFFPAYRSPAAGEDGAEGLDEFGPAFSLEPHHVEPPVNGQTILIK